MLALTRRESDDDQTGLSKIMRNVNANMNEYLEQFEHQRREMDPVYNSTATA